MIAHTQPSWLVGMEEPVAKKAKNRPRTSVRKIGAMLAIAGSLYLTFLVGFASYQYVVNGMDFRHAIIYGATGNITDKTSLRGLY